jgi:hypothetical protein
MMTAKSVGLAIAIALGLWSAAQAQSGFTTGTIADSGGGYATGGDGTGLYAYAPRYQRHARR